MCQRLRLRAPRATAIESSRAWEERRQGGMRLAADPVNRQAQRYTSALAWISALGTAPAVNAARTVVLVPVARAHLRSSACRCLCRWARGCVSSCTKLRAIRYSPCRVSDGAGNWASQKGALSGEVEEAHACFSSQAPRTLLCPSPASARRAFSTSAAPSQPPRCQDLSNPGCLACDSATAWASDGRASDSQSRWTRQRQPASDQRPDGLPSVALNGQRCLASRARCAR